eukprot:scaffold13572_cov71-Cyclotella_meneghiniana.AAC.7
MSEERGGRPFELSRSRWLLVAGCWCWSALMLTLNFFKVWSMWKKVLIFITYFLVGCKEGWALIAHTMPQPTTYNIIIIARTTYKPQPPARRTVAWKLSCTRSS